MIIQIESKNWDRDEPQIQLVKRLNRLSMKLNGYEPSFYQHEKQQRQQGEKEGTINSYLVYRIDVDGKRLIMKEFQSKTEANTYLIQCETKEQKVKLQHYKGHHYL